MTFDQREVSTQDGVPIALYEFSQAFVDLGDGTHVGRIWRYNTSDRPITFGVDLAGNPLVWLPETISDAGVTLAGGSEMNEITITVPYGNPVSNLFTGTPSSNQVKVSIRRIHYEDDEAPLYWMGYISSRKVPQDGQADLLCNSIIASFSVTGLRMAYTRECPLVLYGTQCKLVPNFVSALVTATTGNTITAAEFAGISDGVNNLDGGTLAWILDDGSQLTERRGISAHHGDTVSLLTATDGVTAGMTVFVATGCNHARTGCNAHNNLPRYGGFAHLPGKSPFDGDPVF